MELLKIPIIGFTSSNIPAVNIGTAAIFSRCNMPYPNSRLSANVDLMIGPNKACVYVTK